MEELSLEKMKSMMQKIDFVYVYGLTREDLVYAFYETNRKVSLIDFEDGESLLEPTEKNIYDFFDCFVETQYEMLDGKFLFQMKDFLLNSALDSVMREELKQCFDSYENEKYYPCVCGLLPLIERSILADLSSPKYNWENLEEDFKKSHKKIIKGNNENDLTEYGIRLFIKKLAKRTEFSDNEPKRLNRNWVLHGRNIRIPTKTDCLKLFNLIETIIRMKKQPN